MYSKTQCENDENVFIRSAVFAGIHKFAMEFNL